MKAYIVEPPPGPKAFEPVTLSITLETPEELASFTTRFYFSPDTIADNADGNTVGAMVKLGRRARPGAFTCLWSLLMSDAVKQGLW